MKNSPDYDKLKKRMESSKFSGSGFLGNDKRPIDEIIADDLHQMKINNIDREDLVVLLKIYYEKIKSERPSHINRYTGVITYETYYANGKGTQKYVISVMGGRELKQKLRKINEEIRSSRIILYYQKMMTKKKLSFQFLELKLKNSNQIF